MSPKKGRGHQAANDPPGRRSGRYPDATLTVVRLTDPALKDLGRLRDQNPEALRWAVKRILLLEQSPDAGEPLHGALQRWRKLVVGDRRWRIVWRTTSDDVGNTIVDVAEVWAVGARSDSEAYTEMRARVKALPPGQTTMALADVLDRLGRSAAGFAAVPEPVTWEPLPEWLANDLVGVAGLTPETVRSLTLSGALATWGEWRSQPPLTGIRR